MSSSVAARRALWSVVRASAANGELSVETFMAIAEAEFGPLPFEAALSRLARVGSAEVRPVIIKVAYRPGHMDQPLVVVDGRGWLASSDRPTYAFAVESAQPDLPFELTVRAAGRTVTQRASIASIIGLQRLAIDEGGLPETDALEMGRRVFELLSLGGAESARVMGALGSDGRLAVVANHRWLEEVPWEAAVLPTLDERPLAIRASFVRAFPVRSGSEPSNFCARAMVVEIDQTDDEHTATLAAACRAAGFDTTRTTLDEAVHAGHGVDVLVVTGEGDAWFGDVSVVPAYQEVDTTRAASPQLAALVALTRPTLMILDYCRSGERLSVDRSAIVNYLGAGAGYVVAYGSAVSARLSQLFVKTLLNGVIESGDVERAVQVGRTALLSVGGLGAPDWWIPRLYSSKERVGLE